MLAFSICGRRYGGQDGDGKNACEERHSAGRSECRKRACGAAGRAAGRTHGAGRAPADWMLLLARSRAELEQHLPQAQARLAPGGALWVAYIKGGTKAGSDIDRDSIRAHAQTLGLDSVAMIAIDTRWSALRLKRG